MTKTPKRSSDLANCEPTPPTSRDSVANAIDRWDEEGGAPATMRCQLRAKLNKIDCYISK
jgi:hypothetical protein